MGWGGAGRARARGNVKAPAGCRGDASWGGRPANRPRTHITVTASHRSGPPQGAAGGPFLMPIPPRSRPNSGPRRLSYATPLAAREPGPILSNRGRRARSRDSGSDCAPWRRLRRRPGMGWGGAGAGRAPLDPGQRRGPCRVPCGCILGGRPANRPRTHIAVTASPRSGPPQGAAGAPFLKPMPPQGSAEFWAPAAVLHSPPCGPRARPDPKQSGPTRPQSSVLASKRESFWRLPADLINPYAASIGGGGKCHF